MRCTVITFAHQEISYELWLNPSYQILGIGYFFPPNYIGEAVLQIDNLEAKSGSFIILRCIFKHKCFSFRALWPQSEDTSDTVEINVPGLSVCKAVYRA